MTLTKKFLLILFLAVVAISFLFVIFTEFNPVGYDYYLEEDESIMIIEEGFVQKERYQVEVTTSQALRVVLPITEAKQLWNVNLAIFSLLVAAFGYVFKRYIRTRKYAKWYVLGFILALNLFTAGHIHEHLQLYETITEEVNSIRE
ncbi:hypothetical protein RYX56_00105 [Alkalihalophilus lindianensis]|uniref:DUF4306 domain-containing protein n=1 Tax=Alkalihalophilus lindianensis TaxID=1630542 RepID=A0ABU3X4E5_9BACI|nr:hypothetical protein [Alkalihalophilus lindianensis]MDV2682766.1 hypothetical protein [Alkalihalophilus lindianensis]